MNDDCYVAVVVRSSRRLGGSRAPRFGVVKAGSVIVAGVRLGVRVCLRGR